MGTSHPDPQFPQQPPHGSGTRTCQVLVGGKVIIENTASGPGTSASCSGSIDT